jgi:hypothetical protein
MGGKRHVDEDRRLDSAGYPNEDHRRTICSGRAPGLVDEYARGAVVWRSAGNVACDARTRRQTRHSYIHHFRRDGPGPSCGKLA